VSDLCADKAHNLFHVPDPQLSDHDYYTDVVKHIESCADCFPPETDDYDDRIPRMDYDGEIWWLSRRWDVTGKVTYFNKSTTCSVGDGEKYGSCLALCPLKLPSIDQVKKCRLKDNTNYFNNSCLTNRVDCPNCDRISMSISAKPLKNGYIPEVPNGEQKAYEKHSEWGVKEVPVGSLYIAYKAFYDQFEPPGDLNFGWTGSIFFATTILTTIGYGNFSPETPMARFALSVFCIPAVGIFGFFLGEIASGLLLYVAYFRVWLSTSRDTTSRVARGSFRRASRSVSAGSEAKNAAEILRKYDTDGNNSLSQEEMLQPVLDLEEELFSGGHMSELPLPASGRAIDHAHKGTEVERKREIKGEIKKLFETAHKNSKGEIDLLEGHQLMEKIGDERRALIRKLLKAHRLDVAKQSVWLIVGMAIALVFSASILFWQLEEEWTFNDSVYFCIITSTSIGLGDLVPDVHKPAIFISWILYVVLALGLVGALISKVQEQSEHDATVKDEAKAAPMAITLSSNEQDSTVCNAGSFL
jgi:hypothetical protein